MSQGPLQPDHKWNADRPGERPVDDELDRKGFAQQVAKELSGWHHKDSLVVSLNGDWGSGKTTLANLILHYLKEQNSDKKEKAPIVVRFNPWQWSGQDKLLEGFFSEVSAAFRSGAIADDASAKKLARFWEGLKVATVAGGELAQRFQESLTALAAILAGGSGMLSRYLANDYFAWASIVLMGVAGACAVYAPIAEKLAEFFKWRLSKATPTLGEVRANLRRELQKLESTLLVVIDDIDRLTKREMRLLVQLVKANADFPNVVYLLLYQKSILANALAGETGEKGQDFLKKIVQVELEVPMAPEDAMRRFFSKQIEPVLKRAIIRWEEERWDELFNEGIWPYFRTPRDIKRFKGVLEFYFDSHVLDGVLEVNPIDLIMLETLRMFDPVAYEVVGRAFQKQRDYFLEHLFDKKEAQERLGSGVKELLDRKELTQPARDRLKVLLFGLFPQARESFSMSSHVEQDFERHQRICHPKFFRRYFQLRSDPGEITASFISKLIAPGNNRERTLELLSEAIGDGKFTALMDRLSAVRKDVPVGSVEPLVAALFALSDSLPVSKEGLLSLSVERQLAHIAVVLLQRIEDQTERAATLRRAMLTSEAITGPIFCLSMLKLSKEDEQIRLQPIIEPDELTGMEAELLPKLWAAARDGRVWKLRKAAVVLHFLCKWAGIDEVRKWLVDAIKDAKVAAVFLRIMLDEVQSSGGAHGSRTIYFLNCSDLEKLVNLEQLAEHAKTGVTGDLETAAWKALRTATALKRDDKAFARTYVLSQAEDGGFLSDPMDARV